MDRDTLRHNLIVAAQQAWDLATAFLAAAFFHRAVGATLPPLRHPSPPDFRHPGDQFPFDFKTGFLGIARAMGPLHAASHRDRR